MSEEIKNDESKQLTNLIKSYLNNEFSKSFSLAGSFIRDYPNNFEGYNLLALSSKALGKFELSEKIFMSVIRNNPKNPKISFIYTNAGNLLYDLGRIEDSINFHKASISLKSDSIISVLGLGLGFTALDRDAEAIQLYLEYLKRYPDNEELNYHLAVCLRKKNKFIEAAQYYSKTKKRLSKSYQLECLYQGITDEDSINHFYNFLENINKNEDANPLSACISSHASIRFNRNDNCYFCREPFDYIKKYKLPENSLFNQDLVENFLSDIQKAHFSKKGQTLLKNGYQSSGNLFNLEFDSVVQVKKIITKNISKYRTFFKNSNEGFIKNWPNKYRLYGWIIVMQSGGMLKPHMHKEGWLSSSIYLKLPEKNKKNEGDIEFSLTGADYPTDGKIYKHEIMETLYGDMIMFPSSLFHSTIPFNSKKERVVLAFDLIPE
ncbi:MAG: hypothetical protein CL706_06665 [Chloroflexi bacterium]|nr:hypothetical protein [Chloroflexota bacterium]|tara:strand:- start:458 stop:1759 length:1302 start_codon:yes stop_codon:yes gene_type:complete